MLGHVRQRDGDPVLFAADHFVGGFERELQRAGAVDGDGVVAGVGVGEFLREGHYLAGQRGGDAVGAGLVAADEPLRYGIAALRDLFDVIGQRLFAGFHFCQGKALGQLQRGVKVFQRVGLGVVPDIHLHVEHLLQPLHLAGDHQEELLGGIDHRVQLGDIHAAAFLPAVAA